MGCGGDLGVDERLLAQGARTSLEEEGFAALLAEARYHLLRVKG